MRIIETTADLRTLIAEISGAPYVALDTEFMRDQTYWPKLCLIQVAGAGNRGHRRSAGRRHRPHAVLRAAEEAGIVKVLHAARQDIEIFHHQGGVIPDPLFDTQIAAMVCGFGDAASYETLVPQDRQGRDRQVGALHRLEPAAPQQDASSNMRSPMSPICAEASQAALDLLKTLLRLRATQYRVAARLVASTDDLERLASGDDEGVRALHGWRAEVFGHDAVALRDGRLAIALEGGEAVVIETGVEKKPRAAKARSLGAGSSMPLKRKRRRALAARIRVPTISYDFLESVMEPLACVAVYLPSEE